MLFINLLVATSDYSSFLQLMREEGRNAVDAERAEKLRA